MYKGPVSTSRLIEKFVLIAGRMYNRVVSTVGNVINV